MSTLSGGEAQRIRLAGQLGSGLVGVTYVLDEPSIGLHPGDNQRLINTLRQLQGRGVKGDELAKDYYVKELMYQNADGNFPISFLPAVYQYGTQSRNTAATTAATHSRGTGNSCWMFL